MRFGLFSKFAVVLLSMALIPVIFFAYRAGRVSEVNIENSILELHTKLAEKLASQFNVYFKSYDHQMSFLFTALQKNLTWEDKSELLRTVMATNPDIQEISFISPAGKEVLHFPEVAASTTPVSRADDPGFKQFLSSRARTFRLTADPPSLDIYYPLSNDMAGRVHISMSNLAERIASESVGGTGFVVLADRAGAPLFMPEGALDEASHKEMPRWALMQSALKSPSVTSGPIEGRDLVGAAQSLESVGGAILVLQPRSDAYAGIAEMKKSSLMALGVVFLAAVTGAGFLAKRLSSPLLALSKGAEAVAQGNFDTQVTIESQDELRDLANCFNRMTAQLKTYAALQVDRVLVEQQKTEAILFSIADGILMADVAGSLQLVNRRARELLGLAPDAKLDGKTAAEVLPASKVRDVILRAPDASQGGGYVDVDLSTQISRQFLRVTQQPVFSPRTKKAIGLVTSLHDSTAEKTIEHSKDEFLRNITAGMRAPLASSMQQAQSLMRGAFGPISAAQGQSLAAINQALTLQMVSVSNAFDSANIDSGRLPVQLAQANLSDIASRVVAALQPMAAERKLALTISRGAEGGIAVDASLIERVFMNLIVNAVNFTPAGSIAVAVLDAETYAQATVTDTGIGIPGFCLLSVFDKFGCIPGTPGTGAGLGLSVAKAFVEAHRGKIWAESVLGKGSRFSFAIPKNLTQ
ncbi:MAG: HAMP domain-containing protein [Elusimicrobia bacterium]|nr:HAMP domain-containing protein [Elusimicrobiota bacterium]